MVTSSGTPFLVYVQHIKPFDIPAVGRKELLVKVFVVYYNIHIAGSGNVAHFGSDPGGTVILRYNAAGAVDGSDRGVAAFPGRFSCSAFESGFQVKSLSLNKYKRR